MNILTSVISHRPFKKVQVQYDFLYKLAEKYGIEVQFVYQDKGFYDQVPDKYKDLINVILDESADCAGDNLYNSSKNFKQYDYILNMDDDLSRFSKVVHKSGKLGYTTNVSLGRTYDEVNETSADVLYEFIKDGIDKLNSGDFGYVTCQGRLFCEWNENPWKDSKSTSSTQFALWRADLFKDAIDHFRKFEFPKVHGYDQFYRAYAMDHGYTYSCNLHTSVYTKNQGTKDSVIRPDDTFADLSVLDIIFVMELYPGMFKYRKMNTGFVKLIPSNNGTIDDYLKDREEEVLNNSSLIKFTEPYLKDITRIRSGELTK